MSNTSSTSSIPDPTVLSKTEEESLQSMTNALALSANEYIQNHPELQTIIKDFVTAVLNEKPTNLLSYAQQYFVAVPSGTEVPTTSSTSTATDETIPSSQ